MRTRIAEKLLAVEHELHSRVTRVHTYGGVAGLLTMLDTAEGHVMYGLGVLLLAAMDLRKEALAGGF